MFGTVLNKLFKCEDKRANILKPLGWPKCEQTCTLKITFVKK